MIIVMTEKMENFEIVNRDQEIVVNKGKETRVNFSTISYKIFEVIQFKIMHPYFSIMMITLNIVQTSGTRINSFVRR